jgi:hypothetical protein
MAAENCLWGAPRIHGELLKLGIAVSERTVSRYLRGRPTKGSQTWRTFFANHFGGQTHISPVMFADAHDEDDVVDASDWSFRSAPSVEVVVRFHSQPIVEWAVRSRPRPSAYVSANIAFTTVQELASAAALTLRDTCGCNQPRGDRTGLRSCAPTVPSRPAAV